MVDEQVLPPQESKKWYLSKTFWFNLLVPALAGLSPPVSQWLSAHPEQFLSAMGALNVVLRFVSGSKLELW